MKTVMPKEYPITLYSTKKYTLTHNKVTYFYVDIYKANSVKTLLNYLNLKIYFKKIKPN